MSSVTTESLVNFKHGISKNIIHFLPWTRESLPDPLLSNVCVCVCVCVWGGGGGSSFWVLYYFPVDSRESRTQALSSACKINHADFIDWMFFVTCILMDQL